MSNQRRRAFDRGRPSLVRQRISTAEKKAGQQDKKLACRPALLRNAIRVCGAGLFRPDRWERRTHGAHPEPATVSQVRRSIAHRRETGARCPHANLTTVLGCGTRGARNFVCTYLFHWKPP